MSSFFKEIPQQEGLFLEKEIKLEAKNENDIFY